MNFDVRKKKLWKNQGGVSEVIGNILILMITVVLFTTIIAFVNSMPMPEQETKASFVADLIFTDGGAKANLSLRHAGGAVLWTTDTMVLIQKDGVMKGYNLSTDTGLGGATKWNTGGVWNKQLTNTSYSSVITVTVIDTMKKNMIWTSQVTGGMGDNPPAILQRWVDSDATTPSPDPVRDGDDFVFYATVTDIDGDLDTTKVWINAHELAGASSHWVWQERNGDVFAWAFDFINSSKIKASQLDGGVILTHAEDKAGHVSESTFMISITKLPWDVIDKTQTNEFSGSFDEGGFPTYFPNVSPALGVGFGTFEENRTKPGTANTAVVKTTFDKDERVFVRVASKSMTNSMEINDFSITDTRTNVAIAPNYTGSSRVREPFYILSGGGAATVYECQFNTSNLPPGTFNLNISMASSSGSDGTAKTFMSELSIVVRQANSTISFAPEIYLYKDAAMTVPWGNKGKSFNVSEGSFMVYLTMKVMNTQASPAPVCEEIMITDMAGGRQLYGGTPSIPMIPTAFLQHNATLYKLDLDLRYNNGNQWLSGTNSYTLKVTKFADANEGVYSLTKQIFIKASTGRSDFFVGEDGVNVGHANFDSKAYLTYVENNNFFTTQTLYSYTNTPSDRSTYATTAVALGDLTGDGNKDILIGQDGSFNLLYYKNSINTYGGFQDPSIMPRPPTDSATVIKWIACGDINGDGATDFAYVSSTNKVVIYNNTYGMTPWVYKNYGATVVKKIMLNDMNGDGKADLITLAGGKIYVQDLSKWTSANPYPVIAKIPDPDTISAGITDFDVADMNMDGMLDILTVGSGGDASVNGAWVNNYTANAAPLVKKLDTGAVGYNPRVDAGTVLSGGVAQTQARDMNTLSIQENPSGGVSPTGRVNITMEMQTLDATDKNQVLSVVARLRTGPNGTTDEVFYAWYSVDANGVTGMYTPMFVINNKQTGNSDGGYVNYTFRLPAMAAGKAIYVRFTDSSTDPTGGTSIDAIDIDYVAVFANTYGSYYAQAASYRYRVEPGGTIVYTCIRAANITGHSGHLDVVVAKNAYWQAYDKQAAISGWGETNNVNFYVTSTNALMANSAPTLLDVADVNGDGLSDIVVCYKTAVQNTISQIGFYMNLYPTKLFYGVSELGRTDGSGSITWATATNLIS